MPENCKFSDCIMSPSIKELSGYCSESAGEICGPVAAYRLLINKYEGLVEVDQLKPIIGKYAILKVPIGEAPIESREQWVGLELPIRSYELLTEGLIEINPSDVVLSLLSKGKIKACRRFIEYDFKYEDDGETMIFNTSDGAITYIQPVSSKEYFGSNLNEVTKKLIEQN